MKLDLLAFGPHPDDVEIGAGGTLALHAELGYRCGIVDLTAGEMASNGTVEERRHEAWQAQQALGCLSRECLQLPDAHLEVNQEGIYKVVSALRKYQPAVVLAPYYRDDRHPDHSATGELVRRAAYLSGLRRFPVEGEPFRPQKLLFFLLSVQREPDLILDVSSVYDKKEEAIKAHQSQFFLQRSDQEPTMVNIPIFLRYIRSRDSYFGTLIGALWGEGMVVNEKPAIPDLVEWSGSR